MWIIPAFISSFLLGVYDVSRKKALSSNAVIPVLFLMCFFCGIMLIPIIILSYSGVILPGTALYLPPFNPEDQPWLFGKALLVLSSWITVYFAIKHLPLTITAPIKATQPMFTLIGAIFIFREHLNVWQWGGVIIGLSSILLMARSGEKEGIRFKKNKWIYFVLIGVLGGAASGLYDKYLIRYVMIDRMTVQVGSVFYQILTMGVILLLLWYPHRKKETPFHWSWAIPCISLFITLSDFMYFYSLSEGGMVSLVSMIRRFSVVISFIGGALLFKEQNLKSKAINIATIILAMFLIYIGTEYV